MNPAMADSGDVIHVSSPRKPIMIVLAGRTFPAISAKQGDFDDWIARGLGDSVPQVRIDARVATELPTPHALAGVVVSGSHAMVSHRESWSERLGQWMRACVEARVPVLGICYGHQLLAHAFGGRVDDLPGGPEVGTKRIRLNQDARKDPLMEGLPAIFPAQLVHYQSVLELPHEAVLLASSDAEPNQAFRIETCGWGVQFHPEFSPEAMRGYLGEMSATLDGAQALASQVESTHAACSVLERFAEMTHSQPEPED